MTFLDLINIKMVSSKTSVLKEYHVNEHIELKLMEIDGTYKTQIFVNGKPFNQCKFLLLEIPKDRLDDVNELQSIDEIAEKLDRKMESFEGNRFGIVDPEKFEFITPEQEFWAHCSVRHESCMVECGNLRNTKMVSLLMNKPSRNRPRDGRVWLLRHASLEMRLCEALRTMYRQKRLRSCCGLAKDPMANDCKFAINPVRAQGRNVVKRLSKDMLTEGDA